MSTDGLPLEEPSPAPATSRADIPAYQNASELDATVHPALATATADTPAARGSDPPSRATVTTIPLSRDDSAGRVEMSRRSLLQVSAAAGVAAVGARLPLGLHALDPAGRIEPPRRTRYRAPQDHLGGAAGRVLDHAPTLDTASPLEETPISAVDRPPPQLLQAVSVAPPGQSGFFSLAGQVHGEVSGRPGDYGPHVDDQRLLYWTFGYKPASFATPTGTPELPTPGSRLYRDAYGVPVIYGDSAYDVWFATGWAYAQDRLFEMDAIRRLAEGRLAELSGPSAVPGDVAARVTGYSEAEYDTMFAELLTDADRVAVDGCVAGINTWIERVLLDPVQLLPAEYILLQALPEQWTRRDVLATGVLIVRSVASAGGNEMGNVANLQALQRSFPQDEARGIFQDLFWLQDEKAVTTVPASSGRFPNSPLTATERAQVFEAMADYAQNLPDALANGPGTGAYPVPGALGPLSSALHDVSGALARGADEHDRAMRKRRAKLGAANGSGSSTTGHASIAAPNASAASYLAALHEQLPEAARAGVARAVAAIDAWGAALHGGSYQIAIAPSRSATGKALLVSGPQLGYSYPSELYELEVHGGGYNARGATVPGLPVVGIGFGTRIAWALTTGESKTIDTFVETTRPNPHGGAPQYLFEGSWRDQQCRTETVRYRLAPDGVPVGPPVASVVIDVCRTHHGPVISSAPARSDGTALAASWAYAIWGREVQTLSGLLQWNRATTFEEFAAGVETVTWNENTMYADADGTIAYWHPGLYPVRSPKVDLRFPTPGTGGYEWEGFFSFEQMPHARNPAQGYLANWNTKPSVAWLEEAGAAPGQPAGAFQRVQDITAQIEGRRNLDFADLAAIDRFIGIADHRARAFVPLLLQLRSEPDLSAGEQEALALLGTWDYAAYDPPPGVELGVATGTTDGPAPTIFAAVVDAIRSELFGFLPAAVVASDDQPSLHLFDMKPIDNLAMRILDPSTSALRPSRDYLDGRSPAEGVRTALDAALRTLTARYKTSNMQMWRRVHPTSSVCSLTDGVIGPCLTMPFEDRGTYIHHVVFT